MLKQTGELMMDGLSKFKKILHIISRFDVSSKENLEHQLIRLRSNSAKRMGAFFLFAATYIRPESY